MKHLKLVGLTLLSLGTLLVCGANGAENCRETIRGDGNVLVGEGRQRAQFHVLGTERDGISSGRLQFRDRSSGIRLRSRNLTAYEVVDAETRRLTFDLGGDVTAIVTLRDLGRRGRNDFFELSSGEYLASGNLRGGQVRLRNRGAGCE